MAFPESPFWEFSIRVYAEPGVAEACLALQERHDADINVILFCLWSAASGEESLTRTRLGELLDHVASWREEVIVPLRNLRQKLKEGMPDIPPDNSEIVRNTIKRAELDAEHAEQLLLASFLPPSGDRDVGIEAAAMNAAENLGQYLSLLKVTSSAQEQEWAARLLAAAFPGVSSDKIAVLSRFDT